MFDQQYSPNSTDHSNPYKFGGDSEIGSFSSIGNNTHSFEQGYSANLDEWRNKWGVPASNSNHVLPIVNKRTGYRGLFSIEENIESSRKKETMGLF